ncbi:2-amino-4-hydroxy-6-hydroxymethyldihydropteridine diphosphokinase [Magnetococcus sp. PR-3]|uniref:2-amino-4-hydroxy-6- hydroxymethyldihydropteridine diphosphokinase n=1 Tax=Magnetococcus sp. PR-3 TaxID=3120355 RepID=UPI002FCE0CD1
MDAQIGLGANLGAALNSCQQALSVLDHHAKISVTAVSRWYQTEPLGPDQPWYVNGAATLQTTLSPLDLLDQLMVVEQQFGRDRSQEIRWGARPLDLDLLFYGHHCMTHPKLTLPHPHLHQRRFVLQPLWDIVPKKPHPLLGKTVDTLLSGVEDRGTVVLLEGEHLR